MPQHRDPPAFQEYAAALMARTDYRVMTLAGRGLLWSMRLECWVNGSVPKDPALLARVLGYQAADVLPLMGEVRPFFSANGDTLRSPELDDYRDHLDERRKRQSEGGRAGASITNRRRAVVPGNSRVSRGSLVQQSPEQPRPIQAEQSDASSDAWLSEYERASNGT